jgi:hypothetical protein
MADAGAIQSDVVLAMSDLNCKNHSNLCKWDVQWHYYWCFEMRDRQQHDIKPGDEPELHIIEMRKADRLGIAPPDLAAWLSFFRPVRFKNAILCE